ncbi:hypothetical protein Vi05172_g7377 [Venturia inaequalis]|nr:hypothetical protein Vi05172_g7377 [Venturia inaequalis]
MKFIPTFATLLLAANTVYADYSTCVNGPNDGEKGRCVVYHDDGLVNFFAPTRFCLKTSPCKRKGARCYREGDLNGGIWYSYCNIENGPNGK